MSLAHPDTFCIWPWAGLEINADGTARPCCAWNDRLRDSQGQELTVLDHSLEDIRNSDALTDLRQALLAGQRPACCDQCWSKEKIPGRTSLRIDTNSQHRDWIDSQDFSEQPNDFRLIGVSLGNICNLRCRICGPWASSVWTKDELASMEPDQRADTLEQHMLHAGQWPRKADQFWQSFQRCAADLQEVRLYGGEPLLIPKQKETLAFLITNGHSRQQKLVYNTNGTVFPADMIDQWQQFREVNVCISVDNLDAKFEYERNLAQWKAVEQNINDFMMIQNLHPNIRLKCVVTVSVFNILDLVDIANWIASREWKQGVFWNILHVMECFCIKNLADDLKQEINTRVRHRLLESPTIYNKEIEQVLEFMFQPADSNHGIQQLRREIVRIDSQRQQWLGHSHAELADLLRILPPVIAR